MTPDRPPLVAAAIAHGVTDPRVLAAFEEVPRLRFVAPEHARQADTDRPLSIPQGQVTTQPSLIAQMIEALALSSGERVLEVGTGYGYQTALLARLATEVWSVERHEDLAATARGHLAAAGVANAHVVVGDGSAGLAEHAPYDAIVVAAAFTEVPAPLADQLAVGGRLVQPLGPGGAEDVVLFERAPRGLERRRSITAAHFVRLYGAHGFRPGAGSGA